MIEGGGRPARAARDDHAQPDGAQAGRAQLTGGCSGRARAVLLRCSESAGESCSRPAAQMLRRWQRGEHERLSAEHTSAGGYGTCTSCATPGWLPIRLATGGNGGQHLNRAVARSAGRWCAHVRPPAPGRLGRLGRIASGSTASARWCALGHLDVVALDDWSGVSARRDRPPVEGKIVWAVGPGINPHVNAGLWTPRPTTAWARCAPDSHAPGGCTPAVSARP
jgi:hypothetical protein